LHLLPSQLLYVIRENHETSERTLELLRWGLIPHGCKDAEGGRKPINARAESVAQLPTFRAAYAKRRCIVPVDCFFEWRAVKGARAKQPFAVAMESRAPFAIGGLWENWRHRQSGEWIRTVAIITVPSNELVAKIHDRMPLILPKQAYECWLGQKPDPHDLLVPYPAELMTMWPVSTRVNKPENDDASLLNPAA
jgi:putative SOS response-associated peptidase YedK